VGEHSLPSYGVLSVAKDHLCEPPGADPHARWCEGWGGEKPPATRLEFILFLHHQFHKLYYLVVL